jgi:phosphoribosylamine-glycine ligase
VLLPPAQDHKRIGEGDTGPNTGGMGAYAPAPLLDAQDLNEVRRLVLEPTVAALRARGIDYRGVIYAGLMLTESGPSVIEFNCRFGDPECETLMPLLGPELAQVLLACATGCLDQAPPLTISAGCSACVIAAAQGYPGTIRQGDPITSQLGDFSGYAVNKINGVEVNDLKHAYELLHPENPPEFHVIELFGAERPVVIPASKVAEADARIAKAYGISKMENLTD